MVLDHLVCGWPALGDWDVMKHLDTIMFVQKDFPEIASLPLIETGAGNTSLTDMDDPEISTDDFLRVNEDKSKDIPVPGEALNNYQKLIVFFRIILRCSSI